MNISALGARLVPSLARVCADLIQTDTNFAAPSSVLVLADTMPCPDPWGRQ
jgi:hypothetical protein